MHLNWKVFRSCLSCPLFQRMAACFMVTCTRVTMKYERFLCKFIFSAMKTAKKKRTPESFDVSNFVIIKAKMFLANECTEIHTRTHINKCERGLRQSGLWHSSTQVKTHSNVITCRQLWHLLRTKRQCQSTCRQCQWHVTAGCKQDCRYTDAPCLHTAEPSTDHRLQVTTQTVSV